MTLTVARLLDEFGLELHSGAGSAPVRWVHCSELLDPTPWLRGGELLLTTGIQLDTGERQREYVARLHAHGIAGLGLGIGLSHATLPHALVDEARTRGLPLFAVPYELPFIALTERAFAQLAGEQVELLRRSTRVQQELERLVLEERGLDEVMRAVGETIGAAAAVLDARGELLAGHGEPSVVDRAALAAAIEHGGGPLLDGRGLVLPVAGRAQAWLAGLSANGRLGEFERLILQQAVTVVALELMRLRIARDTERRLAGDVLAEALTGRLHPEELAARLRPFGIGDEVAVLAFELPDPIAGEPLLDAALQRAGVAALVAIRGPLLCAVVDARGSDPIALAGQLREALGGSVRTAASRAARAPSLRRSFHEARCALEAVRLHNGTAPAVASYRDLGAFELLLSLQDDEALRSYCDGVLAGVHDADPAYADELLHSLDVFLEHNGHWERAAASVPCHRHTLRYRMRRIEEITGRSLASPRDRIEFWLALRGRELAL